MSHVLLICCRIKKSSKSSKVYVSLVETHWWKCRIILRTEVRFFDILVYARYSLELQRWRLRRCENLHSHKASEVTVQDLKGLAQQSSRISFLLHHRWTIHFVVVAFNAKRNTVFGDFDDVYEDEDDDPPHYVAAEVRYFPDFMCICEWDTHTHPLPLVGQSNLLPETNQKLNLWNIKIAQNSAITEQPRNKDLPSTWEMQTQINGTGFVHGLARNVTEVQGHVFCPKGKQEWKWDMTTSAWLQSPLSNSTVSGLIDEVYFLVHAKLLSY